MILAIRTDSEETQLRLYPTGAKPPTKPSAQKIWTSGRNLSAELLLQVEGLLAGQSVNLADLSGIIVFRGPGSFTSLRIGITAANTLAYALKLPIVGVNGDDWLTVGLDELAKSPGPQIITPQYDRAPSITKSKR